MWHKINYVWGALASLFVVATAIFKDRLLGDKGSNVFWFLLGGTVAWWIFAAINAPRLSKDEKERRAAELERLAVEKARIEEEKKRREEERRREEEERRRKEEEEENTRRALRDLVAGLSDSARALLFELGRTRASLSFHRFGLKIDERGVPFPDSAGRELKAKGLLLSLGFKGDVDGFVTSYCLSKEGAAAFREGVEAGLFDK